MNGVDVLSDTRIPVLTFDRHGQQLLALPEVPRARHATGIQVACVPCAARGEDKQGLPYRVAGEPTPLCKACWRREERRRAKIEQREQLARAWEDAAALQEAIAAEACAACGSPEPTPRCWLCAWSWLQQPAQQQQVDEAVAAAAVEAEFAQIAARAAAQAWVDEVVTWLGRLHMVLAAYTSPRPADRGRGRAVELLADFRARQEGARTSARGRPSVAAYVVAVMAVDSDYRSGRRAMPGLDNTVAFAGVSRRAVTAGWKEAQALNWAYRTKVGGRLSLERRRETGRWNDRAEWDLIPLHRGDPASRAPHIADALSILTELEAHGQTVLAAAYDALEATLQATGTYTDLPEMVMRAQARTTAARLRATAAAWLMPALNTCHPHTVTTGMRVYSCLYLGEVLDPSTLLMSSRTGPTAVRPRRGHRKVKCQGGASRSSTREPVLDLGPSESVGPDPQPRARAAWWDWAPQLTNDLLILWPWLHEADWRAVAAVLGSRLGPDWTAEALAKFVTVRNGRSILMTPAAPLAYLTRLLDRALRGTVVPPHPARLHTEHIREISAAVGTAQLARQAAARVEQVAFGTAAAAAQTGPGLATIGKVWTGAATARADRVDREARERAARRAQANADAARREAELAADADALRLAADVEREREALRWQRAVDEAPVTLAEILSWMPPVDLGGNA